MDQTCANELLDKSSEPLNLTDLNDYCKIRIFEHLNWSDLLTLSEISNQLKTSACDVFKRKCSKGELLLYSDNR